MSSTGQFIDRVIYNASGHSNDKFYVRFVRRSDGYTWDNVSKVMSANPSWADSAIELIETGETGMFPVIIPEELPAAYYDVIVYKQDGLSPANIDGVETQWSRARGSIFGF